MREAIRWMKPDLRLYFLCLLLFGTQSVTVAAPLEPYDPPTISKNVIFIGGYAGHYYALKESSAAINMFILEVNNKFTRFLHVLSDEALLAAFFYDQERKGSISMLLSNGERSVETLPPPVAQILLRRHHAAAMKKSKIFLVSSSHYAVFSNGQWQTHTIPRPSPKAARTLLDVNSVYAGKSGFLFFSCESGEWGNSLLCLDLQTNSWTELYTDFAAQEPLQSTAQDALGNVWLLTDENVYCCSERECRKIVGRDSQQHWPAVLSCDGKDVYFANDLGDLLTLKEGTFKKIARLPAGESKTSKAPRWLWVRGSNVWAQWHDFKLGVTNSESGLTVIPDLKEETHQL
ncbi:MAG: hypothetical protein K2Z81_05720 [Cyanobacteria bacterium]|nr:hypothetical protein [Cyanobacteriota bacterium]